MEKQAAATMEPYKSENISVFAGILPLIIQLPILLALYRVFYAFREGVTLGNGLLYSFIPSPQINTMFLGILDLVAPSIYLAIIAALLQFVQVKMSMPKIKGGSQKKNDFSQAFQKQMVFLAPLFTLFILLKLPSVLGLYWTVATIFSIAQQYYVIKKYVQPRGIKNN
jgi:YidC/Oxa1 family membrane protein insertase